MTVGAGTKSGSTSNDSRAVWEEQHVLWECCLCTWKSYLLLIVQWFSKLMYSVCILINKFMYLYSYPSTHSISGLAAGSAWEQFEVRRKMTIEWTQICTWWPWLSEIGYAFGGPDSASWEMNLGGHNHVNFKAVIEWLGICTVSQWLHEFGYALGGHNRATSKAMIELGWECPSEAIFLQTWRP